MHAAASSDPAFQRGFSSEVAVTVNDIEKQATLAALNTSHPRLTIVAGDTFQLEATGAYRRAADQFDVGRTDQAALDFECTDVVSVSKGLVPRRPFAPAGRYVIHASLAGKTIATEVTVTAQPIIRRLCFQVKSEAPRDS